MEREEAASLKLPKKLQQRFFEQAEEAADKLFKRINDRREAIEWVKGLLDVRRVSKARRGVRIAYVDGSILPRPSERICGRFNVYVAGYLVVDGGVIIDEDYDSGYVITDQSMSRIASMKISSLLLTRLERELAMRCLREHSPDLLIIDGSFFGWRSRCSEVIDKTPTINMSEKISCRLLLEDIFEGSRVMLNERRTLTLGIIKRANMQAIDGWLVLNHGVGNDMLLNTIDKYIFDRVLVNVGEYFDYSSLYLGEPIWYHAKDIGGIEFKPTYLHFDAVRGWLSEWDRSREGVTEFLCKINNKLITQVTTDLCGKGKQYLRCGLEKLRVISSAKRFFARLSPHAPPICIETGPHNDVEGLLSFLMPTVNEATGLPFPLDIIDANVRLEQRMGNEFVEEIEARLLRRGVEEASSLLASNNPQKLE